MREGILYHCLQNSQIDLAWFDISQRRNTSMTMMMILAMVPAHLLTQRALPFLRQAAGAPNICVVWPFFYMPSRPEFHLEKLLRGNEGGMLKLWGAPGFAVFIACTVTFCTAV